MTGSAKDEELERLEQTIAQIPSPGGSGETLQQTVFEPLGEEAVTMFDTTMKTAPSGSEGQQFGKYRSPRVFARGGMGAIMEALDPDIERSVALKVCLTGKDASPMEQGKFLLEARVTGQLEHPNIVPVHELGLTSEGWLFFSMKLVKGEPLSALLRQASQREGEGARSLSWYLNAFMKVLDAMAFAHSRGVIHRDLKPANIMAGEFGEVLVMDWGLAKILEGGGGEDGPEGSGDRGMPADPHGRIVADPSRLDELASQAGQTMEGAVMGTPAYMSPEQADGAVSALDERSDIYSLGAILYEILALAPPYEGATAREVLTSARLGKFERPSLRVKDRTIPRELEAAVLRAMARAPKDRYPSVKAFRSDLEAYMDGRLMSAARYTVLERVVKFARRNRAASLAILTGFIVAVLVLAGVGVHLEREENRLATEALETLQTKVVGARSAFEEDLKSLGQVSPHALLLVEEADDLFLPAVDEDWFVAHLQVLESADELARIGVLEGGDVDLPGLGGQVQQLREKVFTEALMVGDTSWARVFLASASFCPAEEDWLEEARQRLEMMDEAKRLFNEGNRFRSRLRFGRAIDRYTKALELAPEWAFLRILRGIISLKRGNSDEALADLELIMEMDLFEQKAELLYDVARALAMMGRHAGALEYYQQVIDEKPEFALAFIHRGESYLNLRKFEEAIDDENWAARLRPDEWRIYWIRGRALAGQRKRAEAIRDLGKALELAPREGEKGMIRMALGKIRQGR